MRIKFKIQRIKWTLELVDASELDHEDTQSLGETYYADYKIKIVNTDNYSVLKSAIIHELTHAFRWTYGYITSIDIAGWPTEEVEEQIANTVEVHGEDIINLAYDILDRLGRKKDE